MLPQTQNSAEMNADAHAEYILNLYRAWKALEDGADSATVEGVRYYYADDRRDRAVETALSAEVRGPWHTPGDAYGQQPDLFRITLTAGGPGLRILGNLNSGKLLS